MSLSRSSVLFYNDFATGPEAEVGGPLSFARDSEKWTLGRDGLYHRARAGQMAYGWSDLSGKVAAPPLRRPGLALEPGVTPQNDDSVDVGAAGSAWTVTANAAVAAANSIFAGQGQTAWKMTPDGVSILPMFRQDVGTYTGSPETLSAVIESLGTPESSLRFRDGTAATYPAIATYTWANNTVQVTTGTGTAWVEKLADAGPNGGPVVRIYLTATGTSGNARAIWVEPPESGTAPSSSVAVLHHAQLEEKPFASSPVVYTGSPQTRATETLEYTNPPPPQSIANYTAWVTPYDTTGGDVRLVMMGSFSHPHFDLLTRSNAGVVFAQATSDGGSWSTLPSVNLGFVSGDVVEVVWLLDDATGRTRVVGRVNGYPGGAVGTANEATPGGWNGQSAWPSNGDVLQVGHAIAWDGVAQQYSGLTVLRHYAVKLADLASATDGTDDQALMDELAAFHLDAGAF